MHAPDPSAAPRGHSITIVTLGVTDLQRSIDFYTALGWPVSPASDPAMCTFVLTPSTVLGLVPTGILEGDSGLRTAARAPGEFGGVTLAVNGHDEADVDAILARAVTAGATLHKAASLQDWGGYPGYSGYFLDPDGHPWEVAYAPFIEILDNGNLKLPA
ncbi:VOC family protein [Ruicaihuangia caeni]|uniref:VOC family protein n=1 Tax=Ruicaihuangia caeni TaxID=3042517 RepID=A0AAW6TA78_9MICO|nr:VOC family protein [Klugiella sp. YN-L-19]MDI2099238.1 VOC family protein [Klugiella sp. YN-L-19]